MTTVNDEVAGEGEGEGLVLVRSTVHLPGGMRPGRHAFVDPREAAISEYLRMGLLVRVDEVTDGVEHE